MHRAARRRLARRVAVTLLVAVGLLYLGAGGALADPAVPTNYRSTVTDVTTVAGEPLDLEVEVLGGDTYLVVSAPEGTELAVPGYDGEPYIRIAADGTVEVNQRSPARWLNDARYGSAEVDVPPQADADAPPAWEPAARSGTYAWHDHRIHFMSPQLPSQVDPDLREVQRVWEWEVPIEIDGQDAVIAGTLDWVPGPPPVTPVALVVVSLAAAVALVRFTGPGPMAATAGLLALALALDFNWGLPPGADAYPALWMLAGGGLTLWAVARFHPSLAADRRTLLSGLAAIPPAVAALLASGALIRPIVPGVLPAAGVRVLVALILAAAVASVIPLVGQLWRATSLDGSDEPEPAATA